MRDINDAIKSREKLLITRGTMRRSEAILRGDVAGGRKEEEEEAKKRKKKKKVITRRISDAIDKEGV